MTFQEYLADLRVGDTVSIPVSLGWSGRGARNYVITKLTKTQIVCGEKRFNRETGRAIGSRYNGIVLPEVAVDLHRQEAHYHTILNAKMAADKLARTVDQVTITATRTALDAAEAVLRERGEWTEGQDEQGEKE